ncbi:hypothetical protein, partial [Shewanella sp.]|uniref:hypothetical protein n=1 Tax=Shewanella sp. TaxID=50422 RepID=UPI0025F8CBFB
VSGERESSSLHADKHTTDAIINTNLFKLSPWSHFNIYRKFNYKSCTSYQRKYKIILSLY